MKKKLILVGNKPPTRKHLAEEIASFDYVMRVNRMNYLLQTAINRLDYFLKLMKFLNMFVREGNIKRKLS